MVSQQPRQQLTGTECPRCGYLGWVPMSTLDEDLRRAAGERLVELRARLSA